MANSARPDHPDQTTILCVTVAPLTSPKGHFRYVVHYLNGEQEIVRAKATRRYANCFLWTRKVNHGAPSGSIGEFCTLGKQPGNHQGAMLLAIFPISDTPPGSPF